MKLWCHQHGPFDATSFLTRCPSNKLISDHNKMRPFAQMAECRITNYDPKLPLPGPLGSIPVISTAAPLFIPPSQLPAEIPRRLAALPDHPDYHALWSKQVYQVYLNDVPVKDVVVFDMEEGWIDFHVRDAKGNLIRADDGAGNFLLGTRREHGEVTARFRVPAAPKLV